MGYWLDIGIAVFCLLAPLVAALLWDKFVPKSRGKWISRTW